MLTQEILKTFLEYNPETGVFKRKGFVDRWGNFIKKNNVLSELSKEGYLVISINKKLYKAHRLVFLYMLDRVLGDGEEVDHVDGNKGNNRFDNLRIVNRSVNMKNKSIYTNNTTGVIGVSRFGNRYRARINLDGKRFSLGLFDSVEDAAVARSAFEKEFGYCENHGRKK